MSRCRFVEDHQAAYPVSRLCTLAGVPRSSFYAWRCRPLSKRALANDQLLGEIREIHERSRGTYGRVKILGQLARRGIPANSQPPPIRSRQRLWVDRQSFVRIQSSAAASKRAGGERRSGGG